VKINKIERSGSRREGQRDARKKLRYMGERRKN
jgi:hypothetical protein